jgi:UDP-3-O-[3-hydroxymyristoyl] glucosamine N-acyltransferase
LNSELISNTYSLNHVGSIQEVDRFGSLENEEQRVLLWTKSKQLFLKVKKGVLLAPQSFSNLKLEDEVTYLFCEKSPRLIFAKVLNDFFKENHLDDFKNCIDIHRSNTKITIGENVFIGENVTIGDGTQILHNTSIFSNSVIGKDCLINTNCSISTPGLGCEFDGDRIVKFPQFGGVVIGDRVELGPNTTIRRGALDNTIVGSGTLVGSLSNIGHNCRLGENCVLTSQIALGGSTIIGDKVFMGINSSTKNKVVIGNDVTVGMGAVVVKDVPDNSLAIGVPAKITPKK